MLTSGTKLSRYNEAAACIERESEAANEFSEELINFTVAQLNLVIPML